MTHNITAEQHIIEGLKLQAAMCANKIMTFKATKSQVKSETDADMQARIAKYVNAGLITEETYAPKLNSELYRLKQQAKAVPQAATQSTGGSKDGLWNRYAGVNK